MRLNEFQLSAHKPSFYLDLFDKAKFQIKENLDQNSNAQRRQTSKFQAELTVGPENSDFSFDVCIDLQDASIPPEMLQRARFVVSNIVDMDKTSRMIGGGHDENERLAIVLLTDDEIRLQYWATAFNTEWDVVFKVDKHDDWRCLGIPDFRNPGSYIR